MASLNVTSGGVQVMTDEIEEREVAIDTISIFIDYVPEICYDFVDQLSQLMLSLTSTDARSANGSINSQ